MADVASRELRNNTRTVLARAEAGERVTITVDGRPVATLAPIHRRRRWMARHAFCEGLVQTDAALSDVLRELAPDTIDDVSDP